MLTKQELKDEADFNSSRISETSRIVGFGLLASYYALTISPSQLFVANETLLLLIGILGAFAVLCDYLQYVSGYAMARTARWVGEPYSYKHSPSVFFFGVRVICFWAKQAAAISGSIALIAFIWSAQN